MEEYLKLIRNKGYEKIVIDSVRSSILLAEQYISMPNSQKIGPELISEINKIYKNNKSK